MGGRWWIVCFSSFENPKPNCLFYQIFTWKEKKCIFSLVVAKNLNYLMQFWIIFTAKQNYFFPISLFVKIFYDQKNIRSVKKKKKKIEYFSKLSVVKCFLQSTKQSNEESINNTWENVLNADEIPGFRLIIWIIMTFWQK